MKEGRYIVNTGTPSVGTYTQVVSFYLTVFYLTTLFSVTHTI
jgi:hypothetical protein